jgi:hypothetical protein
MLNSVELPSLSGDEFEDFEQSFGGGFYQKGDDQTYFKETSSVDKKWKEFF